MKYAIAGVTFALLLCVSGCKPGIDNQLAKKVTRQWYKSLAAISKDCSKQKSETLDATLAKLNIKREAWQRWKTKNKDKFDELRIKFKKRHCGKKKGKGKKKKK